MLIKRLSDKKDKLTKRKTEKESSKRLRSIGCSTAIITNTRSSEYQEPINKTAYMLLQKIRHVLMTKIGILETEATMHEFYSAFCTAIHEERIINWTATNKTYNEKHVRSICYIYIDNLPGKVISFVFPHLGV